MNGIIVFGFLVAGYLLACLFYRVRDAVRIMGNFLAEVLSNVFPRE